MKNVMLNCFALFNKLMTKSGCFFGGKTGVVISFY